MRVNFSTRLACFSAALVFLSVGLSSWLVYRDAKAELARSLGDELLAIARSTASLIDADVLELIYRTDEGGISLPDEFALVREQLHRIRIENDLPGAGSPIYVMRPLPDYARSGQLEFVVMPDPNAQGEYFVGNVYPAQPHNRRALEGRASASEVYTDSEGVWISASAPIRDSRGRLAGIVQVDRPVNFFYERARERSLAIVRGALFSICAGIAVSVLFARGLTRPLRDMDRAIEEIGAGGLERRVGSNRNDEIGDLARGIDLMAERLQRTQKEADTATLALVTSGRLAAVGQLAAGVAHEINNPLTYARANLSLLCAHWEKLRVGGDARGNLDPDEALEVSQDALEGVDRALEIVQDIKGFAHAGTQSRMPHDLNALVDNAVRVAGAQIGGGVRVTTHYSNLPRIPCAAQELKQVFLNLLINASQALGAKGEIRVSSRVEGDLVVVSVADDGPGIPSDVMARLFDPFFTTKSVGEGTGLGLSISYEIVRRHEGEIAVESEPGRGATFSVRLPIHPDESSGASRWESHDC